MKTNSKETNEIYTQISEKILRARKSSRKKIDSIARKLNINSSYLDIIESGDYEKIPDEVYLRGYIKSYAKFLNVDIMVELRDIDKILNKKKNKSIYVVKNPLPSKFLIYLMTTFCVAIIFLFVLNTKENKLNVDLSSKNNENKKYLDKTFLKEYSKNNIMILQEKQKESFSNLGKESKVIVGDNPNYSEKMVELEFFEETWIQIFDHNNSLLQSGLFNNESLFLKVDEKNLDYVIDTGNLGGFKILFNGKVLKKIGQSGEVKKKILLSTLLEELEKKSY